MVKTYRNRIVCSGVALIAVTYGFARYNYGLFLPSIRTEFVLPTTILGLIASGSYAGYLMSTLISSLITARTGPKFTAVIGGLFACLGLTLVAITNLTWVLAVGVIIAGSGAGWVYPAMPEAVTQVIPKEKQNRSLSWINSGTSFGVLLSGPIAIFFNTNWRVAWYCFALITFVVTIWNLISLPGKKTNNRNYIKINIRWLLCSQSKPLFITAFFIGFITSIFWTFSVDILVQYNPLSRSVGQVFWIIVGGAGVIGIFAGHLIDNFKFRSIFIYTTTGLSIALILIALNPSSRIISYCSAILFGCSYFLITGLLAIWSIKVFKTRPSTGLGSVFLTLSSGQILGPTVFGGIALVIGMRLLFIIGGGFLIILFFIIPKDVNSIFFTD
ncbi:MFS transporter [Candidatus Peregrinibacteria bacterium]|nr:MFS transporter [Candidatus Peregrinibacteria bacterium]